MSKLWTSILVLAVCWLFAGGSAHAVPLSQSSSNAITPGNSVSCNDDRFQDENSYWRDLTSELARFAPGRGRIRRMQLGVQTAASAGDRGQPLQIRFWTGAGVFPSGVRSQLGATLELTVADQMNSLLDVRVPNVAVDAGEPLIVEVHLPNGRAEQNLFAVGSNELGESGPTYISAPACSISVPTPLASIGFPDMHLVLSVDVDFTCGNGRLDAGEACDDGDDEEGDGCDSNCSVSGCGNDVLAGDEVCDDGNRVNADGCDDNCKPTGCGNGVLAGFEGCDDGDMTSGDGCDSNCEPTGCSNGVVTSGEACDDENEHDGDGCDNNCTLTACGNGIRTEGEACDDGNQTDGDGCDSNCRESGCGNGAVAISEACDDGNEVDGDGCDSDCSVTACGNGIVTGDELCDDGNATNGDGCDSNCRPSACGNAAVGGEEACDDGNDVNGDGCNNDCTIAGCGNGMLASAEQCDDGDATNGDGCDNNCTPTGCGNGIASSGEACDDGNALDGDGCDANCSASACGNGVTAGREGCDDGNDTNGDGCDNNCSMTVCGNGVLTNGEACDDANRSDGDGCSALCVLEPLLIRSRPFEGEVAGCSAGGVRIQYGYDADHDGALDDREVKSTDHICSGAPGAASPAGAEGEEGEEGPAGLDTVSRLTRIAAGDANCAAGGVRVEFGRDRDRDGMLSDSEVEQQQTLCDATSPGSALFELVPLESGDAKCPSGGVSVRSGLDDGAQAGNGKLEPDEIDSQRELCSSPPSVIITGGDAGECGVRRAGAAAPRWSLVALLLAAVTWMRRRRS